MMSILRSIDEDCTHNQDKVSDYAVQWNGNGVD